MAKCEIDGCTLEATHSVTVNIPAEGVPIDLHHPVKMYMDVTRCMAHAKEFGKTFSWADNEQLRDAIDDSLRECSATKADYARTFHSLIKLDDPAYLDFLNFKAKHH